MKRYISHWVRFLLYVMRVFYYSYLDRPEGCLVKLTSDQERYLGDVLQIATSWDGMLDAKSKLRDAVKLVSRALIKQHLQGNPYDSALVSYTAARAVSEQNQAWLEPDSFTPFLAGVIWDTQLIIAEDCYEQSLQQEDFNLVQPYYRHSFNPKMI